MSYPNLKQMHRNGYKNKYVLFQMQHNALSISINV